jgi:methionine biosynthesis protein MetW
VLQLNLESGLALFADHSFDVVLQINTLQNLRNAKTMLLETARVGRLGVVVFPNFAHWPNRWAVLRGRMPVTKALPYQWHDTPNIRVGTFADFANLAHDCALRVHNSFGLKTQPACDKVPKLLSNALADSAVFTLSRNA